MDKNLMIFILVIAVFCILMIFFGIKDIRRVKRLDSEIDGTIVKRRCDLDYDSRSKSWKRQCFIDYVFTVNNQEYKNTYRKNIFHMFDSNKDKITVYFNKNNPYESSISNSYIVGILFILGGLGIASLISYGIFTNTIKFEKKM